jgi:peptidoglycan/LPS O-acetylase OafA/YrhL
MAVLTKNSLDLLRLVAAGLVLFSHQHILIGQPEPSFFGLQTFGGAGVTIFFFLSGALVWSSWARDSNIKRFFARRLLRILPGLWVVVFLTMFLLGPLVTTNSLTSYFFSPETLRYVSTAFLAVRHQLPGVFANNPYPFAVNGSLWTLPLEFFCYFTVCILGSVKVLTSRARISISLLIIVVISIFAPLVVSSHFNIHFEMIIVFWAGVLYAEFFLLPETQFRWSKSNLVLAGAAFVFFAFIVPRGTEQASMLVFSACLVHMALKMPIGSKLTDRLGDLSYGLYIFAFPVQQLLVQWTLGAGWSFGALLSITLLITVGLAFASWHLVEKPVLRFKPRVTIPS